MLGGLLTQLTGESGLEGVHFFNKKVTRRHDKRLRVNVQEFEIGKYLVGSGQAVESIHGQEHTSRAIGRGQTELWSLFQEIRRTDTKGRWGEIQKTVCFTDRNRGKFRKHSIANSSTKVATDSNVWENARTRPTTSGYFRPRTAPVIYFISYATFINSLKKISQLIIDCYHIKQNHLTHHYQIIKLQIKYL